MDAVYRKHSGYFNRAFEDIDDIANKMLETLQNVEWDTMVGTGLSGTLVVPTLARTFGSKWAIVRKEISPHTNLQVEGEIGHKWLFVDDFISSGDTLRRVQSVINDLETSIWHDPDRSGPYSDKWYGWWEHTKIQTEWVGTYEYEKDSFTRTMPTYW